MSKLYVVPTPIGNLEDITIRAINVLKEVDLILAEDTRTTKKLLQKYEIESNLQSHHIHNEHKTLESVVGRIKLGELTAVVSDAGTPAISDPGFLLIRECIANDIEVICLPGPSAILPAIVGSGFPCDRFIFEGFLPHKKGRQTRWKTIAAEERAVVLYESPHRLVKALKEVVEYIGPEQQICVAREITKLHEEFKRGSAEEVLKYYEEKKPKGEIVIVIDAKK